MDRIIIYPGQIPLETDLLGTNRAIMIALGKLSGAIFGTAGTVNGLTVTPHSPAALSVVVGPGEIYSVQNVDNTAYSSLPADTTDTITKQGIQLGSVVLPCVAPTTAGFSINYLIEATYSDADTDPVILPYYNSSNPSQAYSGPDDTGVSQATVRAGQVTLQAKAGIAAVTGTQITPAADAGYVALAVVTVANGQTTIIAGNIAAATGSQILGQPVSKGRLLNVQAFSTSGIYAKTPGTANVKVRLWGGGGGGSGGTNSVLGSGGGGGGYGEGYFAAPTVASVTIGASGTAGAIGGSGGSGGTSSFGSLLVGTGGGGANTSGAPGGGGTVTGGFFGVPGTPGRGSFGLPAGAGQGGASFGGSGGNPHLGTGDGGISPGGGGAGGGSVASPSGTTAPGGPGGAGFVIVEEYS